MEALSVITLLVTVFTIGYFTYMFHATENNVAFFLCVEIFAFVANLLTISSGAFTISILYLVASVAFLGIGFAINKKKTIAFYTGIGGWFKRIFTNKETFGWQILSFLLPPAGIALYFVNYKANRSRAEICGKMGLWGVILWVSVICLILGMISGLQAPTLPPA
ncbi:MAG: hypothetical protein J6C93_00905 [Clostridia bacterium]|nr:hypothetical protein [Clostridia bacterium]